MKILFTKITEMIRLLRIRMSNNKIDTYYTILGMFSIIIMTFSTIALFNIMDSYAIVELNEASKSDEVILVETTSTVATTSSIVETTTTTSTTTIPVTTIETTTTVITTTTPVITEPPIITEPIIVEPEPEYMLFKPKTHYVHRSTCRWNCGETRRIESAEDIGDSARICTECNPDITIENVYEEPVVEPVIEQHNVEGDGQLLGVYQATWYTAVDMGYSAPPKGASGRTLETAYSVASNSIPQGSIIRIEGGGIDGIYRVDDRGGMANNVIDMYYYDRSSIPASFKRAGRININVYLIE